MFELHPLLNALQQLLLKEEYDSSKLRAVMQHAVFDRVVVYVITDSGQMITKVWRTRKTIYRHAFGQIAWRTGRKSRHTPKMNIVRAIAKIRQELADEASITITTDNLVGMSPLMVVGNGLVQIAMLKQEWVESQRLWVPEAAREKWYSAKCSCSDPTGFWECAMRGNDLRDSLEGLSDWKIESVALGTARPEDLNEVKI